MIQTVTGKIKKEEIGTVLMHEHVSCSSLSFERAFGQRWLDKTRLESLAAEAINQAGEKYRLGLMVDGTPIDLGRDAILLKRVSEISGVKIVASTGFYYLESIEAMNNSPKELACLLIEECENGILDTDIKPGILKCATGENGITKDNKTKLSAVGIVQNKTGLPLYVHCDHREDIAEQQLKILLESGADVERIIIGHCAIRPDAEYLEKILDRGCYICMDQCHCDIQRLPKVASALVDLCNNGYAEKILLSNDYCIHNDCCHRSKNGFHLDALQHADGLGYIFHTLYPQFLSAGGSESQWSMMSCKNPITVLDV